MKKLIFFFLLFKCFSSVAIIEYIAGNIEYEHISGSCPSTNFGITVNIFTKQASPGDSIFIYFGDGTQGYIHRVNSINGHNQITHSIYKANHIYGCGIFNVSYLDTVSVLPIKNLGTNNSSLFFLSSNIFLNSFYPHNDSYFQFNSPALKISKNHPFSFNTISSTSNILAYDSIIHSFASNLNAYNLYLPSGVKINKTSGEIQWLNPDTIGSHVFIVNTKMYKDGNSICSSTHYYKFDVINPTPSYTYDSIANVPINGDNFKQILYTANNTYSFSAVYSDVVADSIHLIVYPLDFFATSPTLTIVKNALLKNTLLFSWSPLAVDEREYPYNFVLQAVSYYPNDSVSNSYQTVSFISGLLNNINDPVSENSIKIYPNPSNGIINFTDKQNELQNSTIEIKNYLGQSVFSSPFTSQIDLTGFSAGMYFLTVQDMEGKKKRVKIIKN